MSQAEAGYLTRIIQDKGLGVEQIKSRPNRQSTLSRDLGSQFARQRRDREQTLR